MKTAITMQPVVSSQLAAIGHCAETNTLAIEFIGKTGPGSLYQYQNFTAEDFAAFAGAESVGKHFYAHIKPFADKHPYERIEAPVIAQIDVDHAEALEMNALLDASVARIDGAPKFTAEADLARCNATVASFHNRHVESLAAYADAGLDDPEVTDKEIIAMGAECGMTPDAWIERLVTFCGRMTAVTATGQRYSRTTFKDNGEPIFLNADGTRNIFCDIAD